MRLPASLQRLLDVRAGERDVVLRAGLAMGLLVAGHTMLETARDALFLQRLAPARLTTVYGLIAALSLVLSPIGTALARRFGRRNGLVAGVLMAAYGTALFHQVRLGPGALIALYTWSGLVGTLLLLQFWLFAGEVFTVAQGKRLFGLIAAGGALGAAASAALAVALVNLWSVRGLLLVAAALFVAGGLVLTAIRVDQEAPAAARGMEAAGVSGRALRAVLSDGYVLRLAAITVIGAAALLVLDYLFKAAAARAFVPAQLGSFFALYYAGLNAGSLLMQLFASGLLIRRLGVVPALSLLPALLLVLGTGTWLSGVPLMLVLLLKGTDGTLRHSTHRVASELVQIPLAPALHDQVKSFIDGPLQRMSQALTAGVLLWFASGPAQGRTLGLLFVLLCAAWFLVATGLRKPYLQRFREALERPSVDTQLMVDELDVDAVEAVLEALSSRDVDRVISAMELLADKGRVRLIPALVLYHEDEAIIVSALSILGASDRDDWVEYAERLLGHASENVRLAALRALSLRGRHAALERALSDPSAAVRAHASFWLVTRTGTPHPEADPKIAALLAGEGDDAFTGLHALLGAIRDAPDPRWIPVLLRAGSTPDERAFEQAALAMAGAPDGRFIPLLIPRLAMQDGRAAVRAALLPLGEAALQALLEALEDDATPPRVRAQLPRAIADFCSQPAADILVQQLERPGHSGLLRYKILRGLLRLSSEPGVQIPHLPIEQQMKQNLLEFLRLLGLSHALQSHDGVPSASRSRRLVLGLLEAKGEQAMERVFHLLQIRHRHENIRRVVYALRQADRRTRAYAMEFLETLGAARGNSALAEQTRDLLRIAVDDLPPAERLSRASPLLPAPPTAHAEALRALMADSDEYLAAVAAYHALELGSVELEREVVRAVQRRPALNRIDEATPLFPMPIAIRP